MFSGSNATASAITPPGRLATSTACGRRFSRTRAGEFTEFGRPIGSRAGTPGSSRVRSRVCAGHRSAHAPPLPGEEASPFKFRSTSINHLQKVLSSPLSAAGLAPISEHDVPAAGAMVSATGGSAMTGCCGCCRSTARRSRFRPLARRRGGCAWLGTPQRFL